VIQRKDELSATAIEPFDPQDRGHGTAWFGQDGGRVKDHEGRAGETIRAAGYATPSAYALSAGPASCAPPFACASNGRRRPRHGQSWLGKGRPPLAGY